MEDNMNDINKSVEENSSDVAENQENVTVSEPPAQLSSEDEIACLRKVHEFLREYDRVPGSVASTWSQMLDTVAVVANSLISKLNKSA